MPFKLFGVKESNFSTYQRMWSFMESARPSVFPSSNVEGVERVVKGKGKLDNKAHAEE